jgi:hypothetical protein
MNLIETIQKNLGFGKIQKVDPNSQEVKDKESMHGRTALAQAAIPAILVALFNRLEREPDAYWLAGDQPANQLVEKLFGDPAPEVVKRVEAYAAAPDLNGKQEMEHIAAECVRVVSARIRDLTNENRIATYVAKHKQDVLLYLPASLQLGALLGNENLDDRTNKMEGPVSGMMHRLEKQFNSSKNN